MHDADVASQMVAEAMEAAAAERGRRVASEVRASGSSTGPPSAGSGGATRCPG